MTGRVLKCGYVPLVDSAPLIIARELGFAADEGLTLNLLRQPSWAALRDLLALGHLDAAHMLAPMPLAMSLGLSGTAVHIDTAMVLSTNGTILGASNAVAAKMRTYGWTPQDLNPKAVAKAIAAVSDTPLRVGVPFPYSMHRLLLDYLIEDDAPDVSKALTFVTTPPPLMAAAVAAGELDLFCVGEPWGTVEVTSGVAELILPGSAIWAHAPEKVLATRRDWAEQNPDTLGALLRAVYRSCHWLDQAENKPIAGELLGKSEHLNLPDHAIDPALSGLIVPQTGAAPWKVPNFLKFHAQAATFPWRSQCAWIGARVARFHDLNAEDVVNAGAACMRSDLYRTRGRRGRSPQSRRSRIRNRPRRDSSKRGSGCGRGVSNRARQDRYACSNHRHKG
jgi:NitT/TauT family transport system ATP-binding protein